MTEVGSTHNRIILAIDTAQPALGLAVARDSAPLAAIIDTSGLPHSQQLFPHLCETLEKLGLTITAIDLFVVNTGPGSFTGLRVGIAAVRGLAATLEKPLLGITAIDAMVFAAKIVSVPIVVMLNASRGEVFCGVRKMQENSLQIIGQDHVASLAQLAPELNALLGDEEAVFIGNGAIAHWPGLAINSKWRLAETPASLAPTMAIWASQQITVETKVEAYYLRPSEAEIKLAG